MHFLSPRNRQGDPSPDWRFLLQGRRSRYVSPRRTGSWVPRQGHSRNSLGLYRILDDRTTLSLDVTYGRPRGYLSDPYKQIGLGEILFAGDPLREKEILYMHPENRPNKRETLAIFLQGRRFWRLGRLVSNHLIDIFVMIEASLVTHSG